MQDWVNLISSVGFPIVCCFMMWQFIKSTMKDLNDKIDKNTEIMSKLYEQIQYLLFGEDKNDNDKTNFSE